MILPEGFALHRAALASVSFHELREAIIWESRTFRMFGRDIAQPRLTSWMGEAVYTYSGQRHEPAPMSAIVVDLRARVEWWAGRVCFNSVLANQYRDGRDSVAWHADDEPELGVQPTIASASFGAARTFAIRGVGLRWDLVLEHGDLLIMSGRSQLDYQHSVPKTSKPVGPRINLTFRSVA